MSKKSFTRPVFEVIRFNVDIFAASVCGCYDAMFCPTNYKNCTLDGAGCECKVNYNPAVANCIPCPSYS